MARDEIQHLLALLLPTPGCEPLAENDLCAGIVGRGPENESATLLDRDRPSARV